MDNKQIAVLDESTIKDLVYEIRGAKVMLDFDLARIYGYTTKDFNRQIKNNLERFPESFRFQLTEEEAAQLSRCKKCTTMQTKGVRGGRVYLPYAFTEQGIYMVMTVLKGELAVKQSIVLVALFKAVRDHGAKEEPGALPALEKRVGVLEGQVNMLLTRNDEPVEKKEWLIMDGERIEAGLAFRSIYSKAFCQVFCIDDYVGPKTLHFLKACRKGVSITIISDNVGKTPLSQIDFQDFSSDTGNPIALNSSKNRVHDRYIVLDYQSPHEAIYHCGASSKDAGNKITTIMEIENPQDFHRMIDALI